MHILFTELIIRRETMANLSTKELNYIKDFLSWELLNTKKYYNFSQQPDVQSRKQLFVDTAKAHEQNYHSILNYLSQLTNNQGGMMN
jgi:spore cortex formation protein SpoVR/YcgB (stage V sporulation)